MILETRFIMLEQIENLRDKLNKELEDDILDHEKILRISQELDELIVKLYKEKSSDIYK